MKLELALKQLIQDAVREVIKEEVLRGRLQSDKKYPIPEHSPVNVTQKPRDPNSIVRPSELAEMLSTSKVTLWRWEQTKQLPPRINFAGKAVGWRYGDIVEWLSRR